MYWLPLFRLDFPGLKIGVHTTMFLEQNTTLLGQAFESPLHAVALPGAQQTKYLGREGKEGLIAREKGVREKVTARKGSKR